MVWIKVAETQKALHFGSNLLNRVSNHSSIFFLVDNTQGSDLTPIFGDLGESEKILRLSHL